MSPQFTISPEGMVTINSDGVVVINHRAPQAPPRDYSTKPVQVAVGHDLSVSLHGLNFRATVRLSPGEALGLMNMLGFVLRDHVEAERGTK